MLRVSRRVMGAAAAQGSEGSSGIVSAVRQALRLHPDGLSRKALQAEIGDAARSSRHIKAAVNTLRRKGEVVVQRQRGAGKPEKGADGSAPESQFIFRIGRKFMPAGAEADVDSARQ